MQKELNTEGGICYCVRVIHHESTVLFTVVARTDRILKNTARHSNLGTNRIDVRAV